MIQTRQLTLRAFSDPDVDALYEIQRDQEYMAHTHWSPSWDDCDAWLRAYRDLSAKLGFGPWTIVHTKSGRVIGWGGLNVDPADQGWGPEVAYFIHKQYQGRGFATELVEASVQVGFSEVGLSSIAAFAQPDNTGSIRVLEKCGFEFVGYVEQLKRNQYQITRTGWRDCTGGPRGKSGVA